MDRRHGVRAFQALLVCGLPTVLLWVGAQRQGARPTGEDPQHILHVDPTRGEPVVYRGSVPCQMGAFVPNGGEPFRAGFVRLEGWVGGYNHEDAVTVQDATVHGGTLPSGSFHETLRLSAAQIQAINDARGERAAVRVDMPGIEGADVVLKHAEIQLRDEHGKTVTIRMGCADAPARTVGRQAARQ